MHQVLAASIYKHGDKLTRILQKYPDDFAYWVPPIDVTSRHWANNTQGYTDEWGCYWERVQAGISGQVTGHPLADESKLAGYSLPAPHDSIDLERARRNIKANQAEPKYMLGVGYKYYDQMIRLRGFETALIDIVENNHIFQELSKRILDYNLKGLAHKMQLDADGINVIGEDWGTQQTLIISPDLWRKWIKPAYQQMFALVKSKKAFVHFHSFGMVKAIIPDLIEIGVDVLNIQLSLNGIEELAARYHGKVTFRGGVDRQQVLPYGSTRDVRNHVKAILTNFWDGQGGYIACGEIGPDVPLANVEAMYEAFLEFGS